MTSAEPLPTTGLPSLTFDKLPLNHAALDQCIEQLGQVSQPEQIAELATQVKILGIQLRSINSEMSMAVNEMRAALDALSARYSAHHHDLRAGSEVLGDVTGLRTCCFTPMDRERLDRS